MLAQTLEIEKTLADLEEKKSWGDSDIQVSFFGAFTDYEDLDYVRSKVLDKVNSAESDMKELKDLFLKWKSDHKRTIEDALKKNTLFKIPRGELARDNYFYLKALLSSSVSNKAKLENLSDRINNLLIKADAGYVWKLKEYGDKMNELNETISKMIEIYGILIPGYNKLISGWAECLKFCDIDGSYYSSLSKMTIERPTPMILLEAFADENRIELEKD